MAESVSLPSASTYPTPVPSDPPPSSKKTKTQKLLENPALQGFYNLGAWSENFTQRVDEQFAEWTGGILGGKAGAKIELYNEAKSYPALKNSLVAYEPGWITKGLKVTGQVFDAATGVMSMAQGFKRDVDENQNLLPNTMYQTSKSLAQIGAGAAAGAAVAAASIGGAPLLAAGAAALGTGLAVGYGYEKVREWITR